MPDLKLWTVEEANAALPEVDGLVTALREAHEAHRAAVEQVADLQRMHGPEAVREPTHPAHAEYARQIAAGTKARRRLDEALEQCAALGVEAKDPVLGLVDFPAMRGSEVVYLCWRQGEPEVAHWHALAAGYAGRKPLDEVVRLGGR